MVDRVLTGDKALDEQIGGFPSKSLIVLAGEPGMGKTNFSAQFLHAGAAKGEPGVYVSFGESRETFHANMKDLGLDFEEFERRGKFKLLDFISMREGVEDILVVLLKELGELKARRLVIDSFTALSQSFKDALEQRIIMQTILSKVMREMGCTTLVIVEKKSGQPQFGTGLEEFAADGVLVLERDNESSLRRLRIPKMRNTMLRETNFLFTLYHGFHLIPRLRPYFLTAPPPKTKAGATTMPWRTVPDTKTHFSSGNENLDKVLGGGYRRGAYVILEIERDVPARAVRLFEFPLVWNFLSQGHGVIFMPGSNHGDGLRAITSKHIGVKTFDKLAKVIEDRRYGEKQIRPYTVITKGGDKNYEHDIGLLRKVPIQLMRTTGQNVLRLVNFAAYENLFSRNAERMFSELAHDIMQNRSFGNVTLAMARPGLSLTSRALNLVNWHLRLVERSGAVLLDGVKPRFGYHAVDVDESDGTVKMLLTPMV